MTTPQKNAAAVTLGRKGGRARGKALSPERRREIALMGAAAAKKKRLEVAKEKADATPTP